MVAIQIETSVEAHETPLIQQERSMRDVGQEAVFGFMCEVIGTGLRVSNTLHAIRTRLLEPRPYTREVEALPTAEEPLPKFYILTL